MEELEYKHLNDVLREYADAFVETYKRKLTEHKHVASGQLINNLRTRIESKGTKITVYLEVADYYQYLNSGRNPTTNGGDGTLRLKIGEWIRQKGIIPRPDENGKLPTQEQLAYLITRKIHREGYEGDGCFDEALQEVNARYIGDIQAAITQDYDDYCNVKILNKINEIIKL